MKLLVWIRDLTARLLGSGRSHWDLGPEEATAVGSPVLRPAPLRARDPEAEEDETDTEIGKTLTGPDGDVGEPPPTEPEPESPPTASEPPAALEPPDTLLDDAGPGATVSALLIAGTIHPVTGWREAVLIAAWVHLSARGSLPEIGYTSRQRSPYAYQGDAVPRFFEAVGDGWHIKTKFKAKLAATVTLHLLVGAGYEASACGYRTN